MSHFSGCSPKGWSRGLTYSNPNKNDKDKWVPAALVDPADPKDPKTGEALELCYATMSKSKGNGVAPTDVIKKYGADTARMFILFKAPPEKDLEWDDADVEGQFRFLNRIWRLVAAFSPNNIKKASKSLTKEEKELRRAIHTAIQEVSEDLQEDYQLNTAIAEFDEIEQQAQ